MDEYDKTRDFFAKNSGYYSKSESHAGDNDLNILVDMLELKGNMIGLDAATGAGFTAVKMAQKISKVYALDMVDNMLEETKKLAEKEGLGNVITVKGYVDSMPFEDKKFNVVTSRRAPHHFRDKNKFAAECYRVLQEGGRIGIDDMTAPDNVIKNLNEMERIRDPSHLIADVNAFLPLTRYSRDFIPSSEFLSTGFNHCSNVTCLLNILLLILPNPASSKIFIHSSGDAAHIWEGSRILSISLRFFITLSGADIFQPPYGLSWCVSCHTWNSKFKNINTDFLCAVFFPLRTWYDNSRLVN